MHGYIDTELRWRCHGTHFKRHSYARKVLSENKKDGYGVAGVLLWNRSLLLGQISLLGAGESSFRTQWCWWLYYQSAFGTLSFILCRVTSSKIAQRNRRERFRKQQNCKDKGTVAQELNWSQLTSCNVKFCKVCLCPVKMLCTSARNKG